VCTVFRILYICEICGSHSGVSEDPNRLCWCCVVVCMVPDVSNVVTVVHRNVGSHQTTQRIIPESLNSQFAASNTGPHPRGLELPARRLWGPHIFTNLEFLALHPVEIRFRCESPTLGLSYKWRISDNLVRSSCGMLASTGERNNRGEMPDPMSLYPPLIPHDVR
jgi:hypothetical protein